MPTEHDSSQYQVRRSLLALRRRYRAIVAVSIFLLTATLVSSFLQTPKYRSRAEIVFQQPPPNALSTNANTASIDPARDVQTQIEVLTSHPVRDIAAAKLHNPNPPPLTASAVTGTNAVVISVASTKPSEAASVANAYANAYIEYKRTQLVNDLLDAAQLIQSRVSGLQAQIDGLNAQVDAAPVTQRATVLATVGPQRDTLLAQQSVLKQKLDETQVGSTLASAGAQVTRSATIPTSAFSPKPLRSGLLAIILGLLLGAGVAFGLESLDDSVKSKEDAERAVGGLQTIGLIPTVAAWKARNDVLLISSTAPTSPPAEAYRSLRTTVQFLALDRHLRVIQVTSPSAGEGKTTTIANLAISLGKAGERVCVLACDLRRPRIHEFFNLSNDLGLTSLVFGEAPLSEVIQPVPGTNNVSFIASGLPPGNPSEVLASTRTEGILKSLAGQFDIVLIDSPPVLPVTDACVIAGRVDGVIIVVSADHTKKRALSRASEQLRQVDAPLIGLVLNGSPKESAYSYEYAYTYYDADETFSDGSSTSRAAPRASAAQRAGGR